ncbi:hypothetical protein PG996_000578 [Apiospora saccharicola]|uniref:Uncharacterized protein n=1 Tax=Apiospora saccharicola TaxID=335842 RepID=A0ABR1WE53_9PEZI
MLAWSSQGAHMQHETEDEVAAEVDEPPDDSRSESKNSQFRRTTVRKCTEPSKSLLTKALHQSDDDETVPVTLGFAARRRSLNSTASLASTADLTSDTGLTSPARTNTPSPPPPVIRLGPPVGADTFTSKLRSSGQSPQPSDMDVTPKKTSNPTAADSQPARPDVLTKKRCISFACGPNPEPKKPIATEPVNPPQRKTCIKFACTSKTTTPDVEKPTVSIPTLVEPTSRNNGGSPSTLRKYRSPSTGRSRRSLTPRRSSHTSHSPVAVRSKKYLTANPVDLNSRLTINDTLQKENVIRRLGKEAEDEALEEEAEQEGNVEDEDDDDDENDDEDDVAQDDEDELEEEVDEDNDSLSGYGTDDDCSDGYNTDNEVGFADSDDEDEGEDLELWTHGQAALLQLSGATPVNRRPSLTGSRSDSSSDASNSQRRSREKTRRIKIRPGTPELPDSTDFVCGTLDEDRPLEDAYISCITQKRLEKLCLIPQDIDPSFPTSEPEDELVNSYKAGQDSDDQVWIHGELEDLHHENGRADRRKKRGEQTSPKRYRSPPPKRLHSPPPKARGRSPKRVAEKPSPKRMVSPPPVKQAHKTPCASPKQIGKRGREFNKTLAFRPGLTQTKSLPRAPAFFAHNLRGQRRRHAAYTGATGHVRGAIDIVKGLEHKRQRRREKYMHKHFNRARKGQVPEKRPQPGQGLVRMRELGLHMAGKAGPNPVRCITLTILHDRDLWAFGRRGSITDTMAWDTGALSGD